MRASRSYVLRPATLEPATTQTPTMSWVGRSTTAGAVLTDTVTSARRFVSTCSNEGASDAVAARCVSAAHILPAHVPSDGGQVWFRVAEEAIGRMPEKTPVTAAGAWSTPSSSGSRRTASSRPASTASRSGSRKPVTRGSNVCGGEDGFPRPDPSRRGRHRPREAPARRLAEASLSPNTRWAYSGALRRLDAWLADRGLERG